MWCTMYVCLYVSKSLNKISSSYKVTVSFYKTWIKQNEIDTFYDTFMNFLDLLGFGYWDRNVTFED